MQKKVKKPEWAPPDSGNEFASSLVPGIVHKGLPKKNSKKTTSINKINQEINTDKIVAGVLENNRTVLARTITLVESNSQKHIEKAQELLKKLLHRTGKSIRIGITGSPGVGKSTFIEALGTYLCENGHNVAVLAIDPSSSRSRGSILGDKTRMEGLSRLKNSFIRPSPSGGTLGGVARKTRESILICEAAGYDVILIETIGVGQSEITVRSMVDFFLLLILPGGGDELQGFKKGAVELADALVINKADDNYMLKAKSTMQAYEQAVQYLQPATEGWQTKVFISSAISNIGVAEIWKEIQNFDETTKKSGEFVRRRNLQMLEWVYSMTEEALKQRFYKDSGIGALIPKIDSDVLAGKITPANAVSLLLNEFFKIIK